MSYLVYISVFCIFITGPLANIEQVPIDTCQDDFKKTFMASRDTLLILDMKSPTPNTDLSCACGVFANSASELMITKREAVFPSDSNPFADQCNNHLCRFFIFATKTCIGNNNGECIDCDVYTGTNDEIKAKFDNSTWRASFYHFLGLKWKQIKDVSWLGQVNIFFFNETCVTVRCGSWEYMWETTSTDCTSTTTASTPTFTTSISTTTSTIMTSTTTTTTSEEDDHGNNSQGMIIGVGVGAGLLIFITLFISGAVYIHFKKSKGKKPASSSHDGNAIGEPVRYASNEEMQIHNIYAEISSVDLSQSSSPTTQNVLPEILTQNVVYSTVQKQAKRSKTTNAGEESTMYENIGLKATANVINDSRNDNDDEHFENFNDFWPPKVHENFHNALQEVVDMHENEIYDSGIILEDGIISGSDAMQNGDVNWDDVRFEENSIYES